MSSSFQSGSWFVQILFGQYRNWGNIGWEHFIIVAAVAVLMVYSYLLLFRRRMNMNDRERALIPRKQVPIERHDMSRRMYALLISEMVRVENILKADFKPEGADSGDPAWGKEDSKVANVHFGTSIAKSYYVLEKAALSRRPTGLYQRDHRTIRDYMVSLRKAFPGLRPDLCQEYVQTYERAVFSSETLTFTDYERFMTVVYELVALINERSLQPLNTSSHH